MERNGAARSRGPLGSPSSSSNKTGLPATPGSWIQAANGYPVLLRGELTLDFPLPATGYGVTAQPTLPLEPMTDDGPVRPTILPGLGGGGAPSPRSRDASISALDLKIGSRNPASVFHRQPKTQQTERKPKPHIRCNSFVGGEIRLWMGPTHGGLVSLTCRTSILD